jgi:hypothetical protein
MEHVEQRTDEIERQISRLYHNDVGVRQAVELMQSQGIVAELVETIYDQLSIDAQKLMTERFHYYTINTKNYLVYYHVDCWTSRYLLVYGSKSTNSAFHEIKVIDSFNDKSM